MSDFSNYTPADLKDKSFLPRQTQIKDLLLNNEYLFLFRTVTVEKYEKKYQPTVYSDSNYGISYSLDPRMPLGWTQCGDDDKDLILISYQSIKSDHLVFPKANIEVGYGTISPWPLLSSNVYLKEIAYYDEVKVPVQFENVVSLIKKRYFKEIINKNPAYRIADILFEVSNHPASFELIL